MTEKEKEMCISPEEYKALMDEQKETKECIKSVKIDIEKLSKLLIGNGVPEEGILFQFRLIQKVVNDHLVFHKGVQGKAWDITKPILSKLLELMIIGLLFYGISEGLH